jgi:hypothetical protein
MQVTRITKVANPRRRSAKKRNPRKMSLKQKLAFGTKAQRAAAKRSLAAKRNPRKKVSVRRVKRRAVRRSNPAHLVTLGLMNPHKVVRRRKAKNTRRKNVMATKTRRRTRRVKVVNPRRRRRNSVKVIVRHKRRARNPRKVSVRRRRHTTARRSNPRRHSTRRRNPALFGHQVGAVEMAKAVGGGLLGVAITKAVPNMLPAGITSSSPIMNALVSAAVAIGAGMIVKALVKGDPTIGDAVMFGGLMQAGSVALNSFLPQVGSVIGLQGLGNGIGDLVAGRFPVPQNPISAGVQMALPAPAMPGAHAGAGVGAIFNPYGRAM